MKSIFWKSWHWRCNGYLDYSLFQDPRQLGPLNWESAKTKWNGRKLKRDWAAEPVIIFFKRPVPVYQLLVDPALWLVRFDRLYQHSQSGSFLSLRKMACGVRAREIEKYTIISVLNEMFTRSSRSHWLASGLTCGKLLKKYLWSLRFIASLWASPKSISCWHVMYILARQWNPWAFFHFTSWDVKPPWQIIFQSSMSSRLLYASSRKITSVELSIIDLLKLFCLVTRAIRLNGTIWNTGLNRLVLPLSEAPMAHGTGRLCSLSLNSARKSAQNCCICPSGRLLVRICSKYLGSGSWRLS